MSRNFSPRTTLTRDGAAPTRLAIILHRARFAFPSTSGAVTLACYVALQFALVRAG